MIAGTMKSVAAAVYRSAVSNDQEENTEQEEDHDEEYVLNSSDDVGDISSDEEEEKSKRDVDEEEEEEEEGEEEEEVDEQKDDDDDDDDAEINSSETNVYLGHARHCYPGSQKYRKTLQRLAKKHGFDWSDRILSSLLKKHTPNAFKILDASSSRWRKASTNEIRSAAKSTISTYRAKH
jgi:FMN phosphatase YigB (HAD superfamily)